LKTEDDGTRSLSRRSGTEAGNPIIHPKVKRERQLKLFPFFV